MPASSPCARSFREIALALCSSRPILAGGLLLACACTPAPPSDPNATLSGYVNRADPLTWMFEVHPPESPLLMLQCSEAGCSDDLDCDLHTRDVAGTDVQVLALPGLKADRRYVCGLYERETGASFTAPIQVQTAPLPPDLVVPRIVVPSSNPPKTGYTLFNMGRMWEEEWIFDSNYLVMLDPFGHVRWYSQDYDALGTGGGDIDVSFLEDSVLGKQLILFGGEAVPGHIAPHVITLEKEPLFVATGKTHVSDEEAASYHHDAGLAADGRSILAMLELVHTDTDPDGDTYYWEGFVIKQLDLETGDLIWRWDSMTDGIGRGILEPGTRENPDPYHLNAIFDRWEKGRYYLYLSIKHQNQIFKIDYETGELVWKLGYGGDFTLLEADGSPAAPHRWFFWQHDAKWVDDILTLYDNGSLRNLYYAGPSYSRAIELEVDEAARTARFVFEYAGEPGLIDTDGDGSPNYGSRPTWSEKVWGGYDRRPDGHRLLTLAHCAYLSENTTSALVEFSDALEPEVAWRAQFDDHRYALYRAEHIPSCSLFFNRTLCPDAR